MEGWGWESVHDPEQLPSVKRQWTEAIENGAPVEMIFPLRGVDGVFRPFLTRVTPVKDHRGETLGWFGTNTDITEQKRTEDALRKSNEDLQQFAYAASHDLQEPLRTMSTLTQLVQRHNKGRLDEKSD